jgi:hypothetical protein
MAGYIVSLGELSSPEEIVSTGTYSTIMSKPKGLWMAHHEATFADYASMKPGDNIYFFIKRKIYGIGRLVDIKKIDCKFSNYPGACSPQNLSYKAMHKNLLLDQGERSMQMRWVCAYEPDPHFFAMGVDMDDILSSKPSAFKMLRAFSKLSFIKFGDEENQAFRDVILKLNQAAIDKPIVGKNVFFNNSAKSHRELASRLSPAHRLDCRPLLDKCHEGALLKHEMALEAGLIFQLSTNHKKTTEVFGEWDYISHQVIASPFKPLEYVDKIDCFGYRYIKGYLPTKSKFLVAELKRGKALVENIEQVMKYVDWVKDEYCYHDYGMIDAYLVAASFDEAVIRARDEYAKRHYIVGRRPANNLLWTNLKLVTYRYNNATQTLDFFLV